MSMAVEEFGPVPIKFGANLRGMQTSADVTLFTRLQW
jgi:hypothetical protein